MGIKIIIVSLILGVFVQTEIWKFERVSETRLAPPAASDLDRDRIPDALEQELAEKFAPILYYEKDEPNFPTKVDLFLPKTTLWFFDSECKPWVQQLLSLADASIPRIRLKRGCGSKKLVDSFGTRSAGKNQTFFLSNVSVSDRRGSQDSTNWITYFHAFKNDRGGITLQYWRFYTYNTSYLLGHPVSVGNHGGDWESIHVALGSAPAYIPIEVLLLGHRDISRQPFSFVQTKGTHVMVRVGKGGHTSYAVKPEERIDESSYIRHDSWSEGEVIWPRGTRTRGGALVNLGEKLSPMPGMEFLQYSGLWGTREKSGLFAVLNSGYWGPAFNETGMRKDGFITAWCAGIENEGIQGADSSGKDFVRECYPSSSVP